MYPSQAPAPDESAEIEDLKRHRRLNGLRDRLLATGLYHSFDLPDGTRLEGANPMDRQLWRLRSFPISEDLRGKTVLDIGPWDGFFTFEMERRGADVTAIDYVDLDSFRLLAERFGSKARYERMEVYELTPEFAPAGGFDVVLFLGVLYHLKHPLLALEKICGVTRELCIVDTFISNQPQFLAGQQTAFPYLEIYERDELGGQLDNWCGPSVEAVLSLVRQAGFASAELLDVRENSARVAAWRVWRNLPEDTEAAVALRAVSSHANRGRSFSSAKEEYLQLWCSWEGEAPALDAVFPEIGGFGVAPLSASVCPEGLLVSVRLPPGLFAGQHWVRVKIGARGWSDPVAVFVDLPPIANELQLDSVQDGVSWRNGEVDLRAGGWVTVWVAGLSAEADAGNTVVEIDGIPHAPEMVDSTAGQVNVKLRVVVRPGERAVRVRHRGAVSNSVGLRVSDGG